MAKNWPVLAIFDWFWTKLWLFRVSSYSKSLPGHQKSQIWRFCDKKRFIVAKKHLIDVKMVKNRHFRAFPDLCPTFTSIWITVWQVLDQGSPCRQSWLQWYLRAIQGQLHVLDFRSSGPPARRRGRAELVVLVSFLFCFRSSIVIAPNAMR